MREYIGGYMGLVGAEAMELRIRGLAAECAVETWREVSEEDRASMTGARGDEEDGNIEALTELLALTGDAAGRPTADEWRAWVAGYDAALARLRGEAE